MPEEVALDENTTNENTTNETVVFVSPTITVHGGHALTEAEATLLFPEGLLRDTVLAQIAEAAKARRGAIAFPAPDDECQPCREARLAEEARQAAEVHAETVHAAEAEGAPSLTEEKAQEGN